MTKHEQTVSVRRAKINTIRDIISKSLEDGKISHEEFLLVKSEVENIIMRRNLLGEKEKYHIKRNRKFRRDQKPKFKNKFERRRLPG